MHMLLDVTGATLRPAIPPPKVPVIDFRADDVIIPSKLCNLPPFNPIANHVLALSADPDIDLSHISRVVEGDPAFAADILFLTNSCLFGFPSRMHDLRHAITLLGLERIKALAVTVAMRSFFGKASPLVHQCWYHSVACALVCEDISAIFDLPGNRAYTAGIMHDIGRLGLLKAYPNEMAPILNGQFTDAQEVLRAEREALHVDHARAGSWMAEAWALPKDFCEICMHHHDAPLVGDSKILQLVKAACGIADAIGFAAVKCRRQPSYEEATSPLMVRPGRKSVRPEDDLRVYVTARLSAFSQMD